MKTAATTFPPAAAAADVQQCQRQRQGPRQLQPFDDNLTVVSEQTET